MLLYCSAIIRVERVKANIVIRAYQSQDAKALTDIFYQTIHSVGLEHYSIAQVNAWAPLPIDYQKWQQRFAQQPPWLALIEQQVVGFISIDNTGLIDWAFTHKDFQRQGIASALYQHIEQLAQAQGIEQLRVQASFFAKPLFSKLGFTVVSRNENQRGEQVLINFTMTKQLV